LLGGEAEGEHVGKGAFSTARFAEEDGVSLSRNKFQRRNWIRFGELLSKLLRRDIGIVLPLGRVEFRINRVQLQLLRPLSDIGSRVDPGQVEEPGFANDVVEVVL
jgi:hypothetical protein